MTITCSRSGLFVYVTKYTMFQKSYALIIFGQLIPAFTPAKLVGLLDLTTPEGCKAELT